MPKSTPPRERHQPAFAAAEVAVHEAVLEEPLAAVAA
jgi:hypothetical protein